MLDHDPIEVLPISFRNIPGPPLTGFSTLTGRVRAAAFARVQAGEWTERGLARRAGLSQPHLHNVLHGTRSLTPRVADRLLAALELPLDQLIAGAAAPAMVEVPLLAGRLGGGRPFPERWQTATRLPFPESAVCRIGDPASAEIAGDPATSPWLLDGDLALLDLAPGACAPGLRPAWFVLLESKGAFLRRVWRDGDGIAWGLPGSPTRVPAGGRHILEILKARVIWIGRKLEPAAPLDGPLEETRPEY